ncbi:hypothetical protein R3P38DRAFT_3182653 [Favolaschia claudopus]|uniref:Uncharacterized protein n=1 Tax=Favolaschia claudopus TaxID=2862362 RepID=A0AAW0CIM0_9AGAR
MSVQNCRCHRTTRHTGTVNFPPTFDFARWHLFLPYLLHPHQPFHHLRCWPMEMKFHHPFAKSSRSSFAADESPNKSVKVKQEAMPIHRLTTTTPPPRYSDTWAEAGSVSNDTVHRGQSVHSNETGKPLPLPPLALPSPTLFAQEHHLHQQPRRVADSNEPVSEWVSSDDENDDLEALEEETAHIITRTSSTTVVQNYDEFEFGNTPNTNNHNDSDSTEARLKFKSTVFRYEGDDELAQEILRPPMPVPYEERPGERALAARKHDQWRKKVVDMMCLF